MSDTPWEQPPMCKCEMPGPPIASGYRVDGRLGYTLIEWGCSICGRLFRSPREAPTMTPDA